MWTGKEPFDLRLTVLRMLRNIHIIVGVTLLGTLLFGGGYYVKNVLLHRDTTYEVTSTYRVSYVEEPSKSGDYYINEMTWNTYVDSKEFLDAVYAHLQEATIMYDSQYVKSAEGLADMVDAKLASDVHVPSTVVTTSLEGWTVLIAQAVEKAMTEEFVESNEQVAAIEVINPAVAAQEVVPDVRPARAFALSGILSLFFAIVLLLLKELGDDSIWLPATMHRRYGLTVVGTINSPEFRTNLEFLFGDKKKVAVCAIEEDINPAEIIKKIRDMKNDASLKQGNDTIGVQEWISVPAPMLCPEGAAVMREANGVLLVVKAGKNAGKTLEYVLEYLSTQQIEVTAALLWEADEWLLRMYYGKVLV